MFYLFSISVANRYDYPIELLPCVLFGIRNMTLSDRGPLPSSESLRRESDPDDTTRNESVVDDDFNLPPIRLWRKSSVCVLPKRLPLTLWPGGWFLFLVSRFSIALKSSSRRPSSFEICIESLYSGGRVRTVSVFSGLRSDSCFVTF